MSYTTNEQASASTTGNPLPRVMPRQIEPKTFGPGTGTLDPLTPIVFNKDTSKWSVWSALYSEIDTITASGTVSGGNWTITVNGDTTANIAHSANAATIQAALEALGGIEPGDVVVTGGPLSATGPVVPVVLTWGGRFAHTNPTVSVTVSGLTGGGTAALVSTRQGVNTTGIRGFVWPEAVVLDGSLDVLGNVLMAGTVHRDDIVLPAGETGSVLDDALREGVREFGFYIQGLTKFH